ncbi:MAG: dTDP-4-dehydrorhamnose 3,5-epimerase [Brevundimonas sp.]
MSDLTAPSPVVQITPPRFGDARGWFSETYSDARAAAAGIRVRFVQDNQSFSAAVGTVRGLHFQRPPHAQAKLVRCVRGSIRDYAVDIRKGSPTYGQHVAADLTAAGGEQLFVPVGFAHGFVTLEDDVEIAYKVSDVYAPDCDDGLIWNDPLLALDWPLPDSGPVLSGKDMTLGAFQDFDSPFTYDGRPLRPLD